jgi:hypothetical protein
MVSIRNGKSDDEIREEQREEQRHQLNLSTADADQPMDRAYINEMTDHQLQEPTVGLLSNLLDRNFMLANFTDAEVHEYRWLARVARLHIESLHPPEDSFFQGRARAIAYDDPEENLKALSSQEKAVIRQFLMAVIARATRGREGWQQEMFNKSISASETREISNDDDGGFL